MKRTLSLALVILLLSLAGLSSDRPFVTAAAGRGTIAYIRGGSEIRLIDPDGGDDRAVWSLPRPELAANFGIHGVAWRPDGKEIAFASGHEVPYSLYQSDIYTINPDGSGLRKITNPPSRAEFGRYPKGTVSVTLRSNTLGPFGVPTGPFIVYVAGATEPQSVALAPGGSRTLTFENVADFGDHPQPVVAMFGKSRWFIPGVDVQAGRTVSAGVLNITGKGLENFGAFGVAWRGDGAQLSYGLGNCAGLFKVPADPAPGSHQDQPMLAGNGSQNVCTWDWGPTSSTANQILIGGGLLDPNVYLATEGGARGEKQVGGGPTDLLVEVEWLPDASGFLLSVSTGAAANLYEYDFATKKATQLTRFDGEFVRGFSVSPDGQSVVFERARQFSGGSSDLWIMRRDGRDARLLVRNGAGPSWGR